jgi:hypothetical protein
MVQAWTIDEAVDKTSLIEGRTGLVSAVRGEEKIDMLHDSPSGGLSPKETKQMEFRKPKQLPRPSGS